jgi:excinuclease ABC subunit A
VIVVEHDEDAILTADHVIDMGPGAGVHGGKIIAQRHAREVMAIRLNHGQYLSGREIADSGEAPQARPKPLA